MNCESAKEIDRIRLFEKKSCHYFDYFVLENCSSLAFFYHAIPVFLEFISITPPLPVPSPE